MKFANYEPETGKILGWYDNEIHETIPTPTIEVSEEQWQIAIDNGHNKVNPDGTTAKVDFRTPEEIARDEQIAINMAARKYLADTDWYVIRLQETGVPVPQEILDERQAARDSIVEVV